MKIISWNINSLRAHEDAFRNVINELKPDVFCLQEIRVREDQRTFPVSGYISFMNPADNSGHYGTAVYIKREIHPRSIVFDFKMPSENYQGRIEALEFEDFTLVNTYWPFASLANGKRFLNYRIAWTHELEKFIHTIQKNMPVIICGDMNMVRTEMDTWDNVATKNVGCFFPEEHQAFESLLSNEQLIDSYRHLHPNERKYTVWGNSKNDITRKKNQGFRIDYFLVSESLRPRIHTSEILDDIWGSDHCPILLEYITSEQFL